MLGMNDQLGTVQERLDTQPNDTQSNGIHHNSTQCNNNERSYIQQNNKNTQGCVLSVILLSVVMLNLIRMSFMAPSGSTTQQRVTDGIESKLQFD